MSVFVLLVEKTWGLTLFRLLFAFIDFLLYSLIQVLFKTMFQLANFELTGFYNEMLQRVYVVLGIFMLFKVAVSLLTYLADPDKINDKQQGASKLITRVLTVLVMLIFMPNAFALLNEFQNKALPVIPRIVIGSTIGDNPGEAIIYSGQVASSMTVTLINGLAPPASDDNGNDLCGVHGFSNLSDFLTDINETCKINSVKYYAYDYVPVVSTLCGVVMVYVLICLCINVAIRAFKLIILRCIAPIPIISYIDPKSSKDGTFSVWVKTFISTWAELFVHLIIIYFIIFIIGFMFTGEAWKGLLASSGVNGIFEVSLFLAFIVIGLLFFAKQAPKFIMDSLGIKSTGSFKRMLGMGATAISGVGNATRGIGAAIQKSRDENGKITGLAATSAVSRGLLSGLGSIAAGGDALLSSDKPTLHTGLDGSKKYMSNAMNEIRSGYGFKDRAVSLAKSITGYDIDADINHNQAIVDTSDKLKGYVMGEGAKMFADKKHNLEYYEFDNDGNIIATHHVNISDNELAQSIAEARQNGHDVMFNGTNLGAIDGNVVNKLTGDSKELMGDDYVRYVGNDFTKDKAGGMENLVVSYANAKGVAKDVAGSTTVTGGLKRDNKKHANIVFKLKQDKGPSSR